MDTASRLAAELNEIREPLLHEPRARRLRSIFTRLSLRRTSSMSGPEPLQPTEIAAWLALNDEALAPWEVELVEAMDATLLSTLNSKVTTGEPSSTSPT